MSNKTRCTPDQLGSVLSDIINEYTDEVIQEMPEVTKDAGKHCVQLLKQHAKSAGIGGSKYVNSFTSKVTKSNSALTEVTVYSPKHYRLTHLLEHGHIVRNRPGGRILGTARAFPHWAPAEEEASEYFEQQIKMKVSGGE